MMHCQIVLKLYMREYIYEARIVGVVAIVA
jgi:hypothetical protein